MAFIDSKGKLFGKINIIDLMVVLFIILVMAVGAKFVLVKPALQTIQVEVIAKNQPYEVISRIAIDSQIVDSSQVVIGEVLDMNTFPAGANKDLILYLNLSITEKNGRFYFQNNELIINKKLNLRIRNLKLDTIILSINQPPCKKTDITVEVIANNQPYEVTESIDIGSQIVDGSQKKKIGEVLDIDTIAAGANKNMILYLNLSVTHKYGRFYFQNNELQTNGKLTIAIGNINLNTIITNINQPPCKKTDITVEVIANNQPYEITKSIDIGSQIVDGSQKKKIGEVLDIDTIPAGANKNMILYLNLSVTDKYGRFYFQNNELQTNGKLTIAIGNINLNTIITNINQTPRKKTDITVEVIANNQPYEVTESIDIGSQIVDGSQKKKIGEVLDIDTIPAGANKNMILYLNLSVTHKDGRFYFQNNKLQTNGKLTIAIGNINLNTIITNINQPPREEIKTVIEVLFKNTNQWVAEAISSKDAEVDHHGTIIAKITDAEKIPAVIIVTSDAGEIYERKHPLLKDVTAQFDIIAKKKGSSLLFHDQELKVGKKFTFYSDNYQITGTITNTS